MTEESGGGFVANVGQVMHLLPPALDNPFPRLLAASSTACIQRPTQSDPKQTEDLVQRLRLGPAHGLLEVGLRFLEAGEERELADDE